jgi:hypothetical protein
MARRPQQATTPTSDKFCDHIFPPDKTSLCFDPDNPKLDPDVKAFVAQVKSWKRPSEWCRNPVIFKDDASPGDITQGQLGDCWLLSALGVVAVRPAILKHLFVKVDSRRGEYKLRFYREGAWEEVTIDDRFPCGGDGKPVFGHCKDPEEIWVLLIEKALAKLLGTYEALDGGYLEEGVVMLTGGRPEKVTINDWKGKSCFEETAADLWHKLVTYYDEGHMMGAAICSGKEMPDQSTGLVAGHAYGVLNVHATKDGKFKLVQLRNPWGSFEWKGKWSDGSREWTKAYIDEVGYVNADDGSFWMELNDFRRYYDKITVCRIFNLRILTMQSPIVTESDKAIFGNPDWYRVKYECEWNDLNAGGLTNNNSYAQNPHFNLVVKERSRIFFLISQPSLSTQAESRYYRTAIGFSIQKGTVTRKGSIKLPSGAITADIFVQTPQRSRYNAAHLVVEPGQYIIVPFTQYPNRKSKFVLEIYGETKFESNVLLDEDKQACKDVPASARGLTTVEGVGASKSVRLQNPPAASSSVRRQDSSPQVSSPGRGIPSEAPQRSILKHHSDSPQRSAPPPAAGTRSPSSLNMKERLAQHQRAHQEQQQRAASSVLPQDPPTAAKKDLKRNVAPQRHLQSSNPIAPELGKTNSLTKSSDASKRLYQTTNQLYYDN